LPLPNITNAWKVLQPAHRDCTVPIPEKLVTRFSCRWFNDAVNNSVYFLSICRATDVLERIWGGAVAGTSRYRRGTLMRLRKTKKRVNHDSWWRSFGCNTKKLCN